MTSDRVMTSPEIKAKAHELGFDLCGIAAAAHYPELDFLQEWLTRGYAGDMAWLPRSADKRADVRRLLPGARTVIVTATLYNTDRPYSSQLPPGIAGISRYAWGDDYHDVMRERLRDLLEWIKMEDPEADGKICVDTTPVLEKAWAVRAGIGWLGKHTNVITPTHGSWVFLGEIILNLEVEYDTEVVEDHCGSCTACIDACPTNAIVKPYVVDSRKCISYATIELRDETLPAEIAANQNGWLYGCDICQDVCPWNRFEKPTKEMRFEPRNNETSLPLESLAEMQHDEYVERFRGSAMKRAKLSGLKRNAAAISLLKGEP